MTVAGRQQRHDRARRAVQSEVAERSAGRAQCRPRQQCPLQHRRRLVLPYEQQDVLQPDGVAGGPAAQTRRPGRRGLLRLGHVEAVAVEVLEGEHQRRGRPVEQLPHAKAELDEPRVREARVRSDEADAGVDA